MTLVSGHDNTPGGPGPYTYTLQPNECLNVWLNTDAGVTDQVKVDEFDEDGELVLELEVAEDDMGRVIGKSGKIARAMRNLLKAAGEKAGKRYELEILE